MTSNLGASEMNDLINGTLGFAQTPGADDAKLDEKTDPHRGGSGSPKVLAGVHEPNR